MASSTSALNVRSGVFYADTVPVDTSARVSAVLDLLYHCSPLHTLVFKAEPIASDSQGSDQERAVLIELRRIFVSMNSGAPESVIPLLPFVEKLSAYANSDYLVSDAQTLQGTWDDIVSVILAVNPPLWEIFLGTGSGKLANLASLT